jgi:polygalacturonase
MAPDALAAPGGLAAACKPFLFSYQAAFSGVSGGGAIDGQGRFWWDAVRAADKSGHPIAVPDLLSSYESQGFRIAGITLRNAAGRHAAIFKTTGLGMSDVKIESPEDSAASTGILLSNAQGADISGAWIRVPAEALALKASILGATSQVNVRDVHVYGGRGISIGDDTYGAVRDATFEGAMIDGARLGFSFNLKGAHGGQAQQIHFAKGCLRNVGEPLRVTAADGSTAMQLPEGRGIDFRDVALAGLGGNFGANEVLLFGVLRGGILNGVAASGAACQIAPFASAPKFSAATDLTAASHFGTARSLVVSSTGGGFTSIQKALDVLPASGGDITVKPGTYRGVVTIRKPHVHLHGEGDPAATAIVFGNGPANGGTFASATVFVEADDATLDHLTIANDLGAGKGQGVALAVTADRATFRNLRILGAQDTLFAASRYCYGDYGPCMAARQYFADSYIEGNTDFIFGDSMAVFERCELHGLATGSVMYTAQSRHTAGQRDSGYVFDHCRLTGVARNGAISLGRPWRPYATVVFLEAQIDAPVIAAGWTEWARFGKPSLPTAYYAEYRSTGPGANPEARESYSHQLTAAEADQWRANRFLAGKDGFQPALGK